MNPEGDIKLLEEMTEDEKKKAIEIPEKELQKVKGMNRQQRRKWFRDCAKKKGN